MEKVTSKNYELVKQDIIKVGKGFLLALAGAMIAFLTDLTGIIDFSQYGEMSPYLALAVGSVCSALVNMIRKYIEQNKY